jgi:hypothetical protein
MSEEYKTTTEEDITFKKPEVPKTNIPEKEIKPVTEKKPEVYPAQPNYFNQKSKEPEKKKAPTFKQKRKEKMDNFNDDLEKTGYNAKLVPKSRIVGAWIVVVTLILLLTISMIWGNTLRAKMLDKNFSPTINVEPANVTVPVQVTDAEQNTYEIINYNNFTIHNNVTMPSIVFEGNYT